ncbi:hypothetical protein CBR_g9129 [Chara braunii]|uniref:DDE Tnp4 domain-containing protein n=1 Tax=Chara braunii TaxID=69332 RepID=A0A388KNY6_CHABU|nr:hypothetical protein CBR_g9129 [Chara braunii]|eukprot:GBG71718.1 hypothetical protein CBR_g9129 [Chara braunii]
MSSASWLVSVVHTAEALGGRGGVGEKRGHPELEKFKFDFLRTQGGRGGGRPGDASNVQKTTLAKRSAWVSIFRVHASCEQRGQLPARRIVATITVCCLVDSDARHLLLQRTSAAASTGPVCVSLFTWFSSGRIFGVCGRRHALRGGRFPEMDLLVSGHGLRKEEIDAVAMAVTAVVVNTMGGMSSSSSDMLTQLRKRRALLQRIVEAPDCVATCEIVAACAAYVEKKVTHYRMPLPVEQVIAFTLYRRDVRERHFGAIGCTHICIDKPAGAPSDNYYDRKQKFSVQAQVVVDLDLRILDVHIGYPGSVHDIRVLHNSQLWRRAEVGELFDAPPENLPHGVVTRGYLLGDNGYPVACPWIVQPYGGIDQHPDDERFDTRQKVARACVERAFGRLKCMWRLFLRTHKTNLETLPQQFVALRTLHNILLDAGIDFDENLLWEVDENDICRRVDLGIVGNGAGGQRQSTNVDGDLLRDALRDRLALM